MTRLANFNSPALDGTRRRLAQSAFAPPFLFPATPPWMDQILGLLGRDPVWKAPA